jgi:hypothetical protein
MKKSSLLFLCYFGISSLFAQREVRNADGSYFKQCTHFEVSRPLRELAKEHPALEKKAYQEAADAKRRYRRKITSSAPGGPDDPIIQKEQGNIAAAAPIQNFDGQPAGYDPLDPTGMVGPNHFVQAINSSYQIFNKNGTAATGVIDLATLFPGTTDDGDPIVMYDKFADRWIVTEFQSKPTGGNENELIFAVSKTPDPTGAYYIYTFEPDAADFADYPKYSIWSDGYYETCNCSNQKVTVYERTKMLNGDQTAGFIVIPSISGPNGNSGFFCPQTLFADGQLPPYGSPQFMFDYTDDNWGGGFKDRIRIYKITANWTSKTGTLAAFDSLTPKPFNSYFTGGTLQDISQPGTTTKLDALDGFFSYRVPYMRWSNYNSAVMCHPVNTGTGGTIVSGIRWYELRQDTTTQKWNIYQQGTYAPADGLSRWNPGIGMDMNGSIAIAFSVSSASSVYPGIHYTGRTKCDSAGIMTLTEGTGINGSSSWNSNRWGDYSHTSLDPSDGLTFWHTNQYMGSGASLRSRIFSFQVPACTSTGITTYDLSAVSLTAVQHGALLNVRATGLPTDEEMELNIFSLEGKLIQNEKIKPLSGILEANLNTSELSKGIYFVRIVSSRFQRVLKVAIQ